MKFEELSDEFIDSLEDAPVPITVTWIYPEDGPIKMVSKETGVRTL